MGFHKSLPLPVTENLRVGSLIPWSVWYVVLEMSDFLKCDLCAHTSHMETKFNTGYILYLPPSFLFSAFL